MRLGPGGERWCVLVRSDGGDWRVHADPLPSRVEVLRYAAEYLKLRRWRALRVDDSFGSDDPLVVAALEALRQPALSVAVATADWAPGEDVS